MTVEERSELEKVLRQYDKNAKSWLVFRWITLGSGILALGLGLSLWGFSIWHKSVDFLTPPEPPLEAAVNELYVDLVMVQTRMYVHLWSLVHLVVGASLICTGWAKWRQGRGHMLMVKLARTCLDAHTEARTDV